MMSNYKEPIEDRILHKLKEIETRLDVIEKNLKELIEPTKNNNDEYQKMNEYNSPAAVMARYRAAGMNPGYAGQMNFANASPPPDSANKVHAVQVPNQLDTLKEYFSLKNAELENSRLQELRDQEEMNTTMLRRTFEDRAGLTKAQHELAAWRVPQERYRNDTMYYDKENKRKLFESGKNPDVQNFDISQGRYQMESGRFDREKDIYENFTKPMQKFDLDWRELGISPNDNIFARLLARIFADRLKMVKPAVGSATNLLLNYFK